MIGRRKKEAFCHYFDHFSKLVDKRSLSICLALVDFPQRNPQKFQCSVSSFLKLYLDGRQQTLLVITYWAICYGDNRQEFSRARDGSLCIPPFVVADAFTAEALVCETAITFASDLGFSSVQVEGDSLSIIKKLNVATMDRSLINPIISDIHKLRGLFDNITFSYVGRKGNMVAHELVKLGTQFSEPMYWMEEELVSVERLVLRDLPP
ncbi:hypothetical protein V6N13_125425 [Hibiscus sabdariffa]